jgi:hypothetical protein
MRTLTVSWAWRLAAEGLSPWVRVCSMRPAGAVVVAWPPRRGRGTVQAVVRIRHRRAEVRNPTPDPLRRCDSAARGRKKAEVRNPNLAQPEPKFGRQEIPLTPPARPKPLRRGEGPALSPSDGEREKHRRSVGVGHAIPIWLSRASLFPRRLFIFFILRIFCFRVLCSLCMGPQKLLHW